MATIWARVADAGGPYVNLGLVAPVEGWTEAEMNAIRRRPNRRAWVALRPDSPLVFQAWPRWL